MKILRATINHFKPIITLFVKYRIFYKQRPNHLAAEHFMRERLTKQDSTVFLALSDHDSAMGFIQLYPSFTSVGMKRIFIINDLFVDEHYRKQGVATALMEKTKEFAIEQGAAKVTLRTQVNNKSAQTLYGRLNYQKETEFITYELKLPTPGSKI